MAHDLFFKNSKKDWSRSSGEETSSGYDPYARSIFERRSRPEPPTLVIKHEGSAAQPARIGWFGATLAVMFSTRILSGKWPWYWAGMAAKKIEGSSHTPPVHQKG